MTITATDDDGQSASVSFQLTVSNVAPGIAVTNSSVSVNEALPPPIREPSETYLPTQLPCRRRLAALRQEC